MSNEGQRAVSGGPEDSAQFADIFGEEAQVDQGSPQGEQDQDEGQGDGAEADGRDDGEAERQARERDAQGRFAKPEGRQQGGEDRAQKGLRNEVTSERSKRQAAEARAESTERRLVEMQAQMDLLARQQAMGQRPTPQPAEQQKEPEKAPDRWTDPEGYDAYLIAQAERRVQARLDEQQSHRIRSSFEETRAQHGTTFDEAFQTLNALPPTPANLEQVARVKAAADPGAALLRWHAAEKARQEIGADPNAYRERLRAELLDPDKLMENPDLVQALTERLRQQARQSGQNGGPRSFTSLPQSLGAARGSGNNRAADMSDDSERGIWDYASGR